MIEARKMRAVGAFLLFFSGAVATRAVSVVGADPLLHALGSIFFLLFGAFLIEQSVRNETHWVIRARKQQEQEGVDGAADAEATPARQTTSPDLRVVGGTDFNPAQADEPDSG